MNENVVDACDYCRGAHCGRFGLNYVLWGRFAGRPTTADFEAIAKEGQPIAQAINDYQSDHGLLPEKWSDIVPAYLPQKPKGWHYDGGYLGHHSGLPHTDVAYRFDDGLSQWRLNGEYGRGQKLNVPGSVSKKTLLSADTLFSTRWAEYERRISQHPQEFGYYQDKIAFAALAKSNDLAMAECERAAGLFPNWWLPQMALAELRPDSTEVEQQFKSWVQEHPTFINYWYLSRLYRDRGDTNSAFAALDKAAESSFISQADQVVEWQHQLQLAVKGKPSKPIVETPDDAYWIPEGFALDAAGFCYEHRKYELALKIIRHCEPVEGSWQGAWEMENLALRAAAELGLGQFDSAVAHAQRVADLNTEQSPPNATPLLQAAKARDTNFLFKTGNSGESDWPLFREPQP